jgi:hypothetical protein
MQKRKVQGLDPIEDQRRRAVATYEAALAEFQAATNQAISRIKAGHALTDADLKRESDARAGMIDAREVVLRLNRLMRLNKDRESADS